MDVAANLVPAYDLTVGMRTTIPAALVALTLVNVPHAAGGVTGSRRPVFSGQWELSRERSTLTPPEGAAQSAVKQTIVHTGSLLTVSRTIANKDGEQTIKIRLQVDNRPHSNIVDGSRLTFRTRWVAAQLVTTITSAADPRAAITERWSLSKDGRAMTIELQLEGDKAGVTQRLVYARQRQ